jgi:methyl-accepting chemotaxis protein
MPLDERANVSTDEIAVILGALNALKRGDATVRLPIEWPGTLGRVADAFNDVVERNDRMAQELARLSRVVGKEGKLGRRGTLGDVTGFWRDSIDAVNLLIDDLVHPTSETARVIGAVAQGDLSQTMALEVDGRRCRASSCAPRRRSTRWWTSSARSPPK